jgi:pimeloyl-ACP methyl ester carboxylesterase
MYQLDRNNKKTIVVLIHGIWVPAMVMWPLARQLRKAGFDCRLFAYPTLTRDLADNAARLNEFIASLSVEKVHLVAHSLGGLLVRALFHFIPQQPPGKIVMIATPSAGSAVADRLRRYTLGRILAGRSLGQYLTQGRQWAPLKRKVLVIAGTHGIGVGTLVGGLEGDNDGTVSISEARCDDASEFVTLPYSHSSLLFRQQTIRKVCDFLRSE